MAAVVLRASWPAPLQINPQRHPPCREPAQPQQPAHLRKGSAIVTANGCRQPMTLKKPLKTSPDCLPARVAHPAQLQKIAAILVPYRQRFAAHALPVIPPALEVHGPHL